jgi:hypothetical protein
MLAVDAILAIPDPLSFDQIPRPPEKYALGTECNFRMPRLRESAGGKIGRKPYKGRIPAPRAEAAAPGDCGNVVRLLAGRLGRRRCDALFLPDGVHD